jgi:REP-associated tyrosine transposase
VITKRPERLNDVDYCGFHWYFLTICTAFRRPIFDSSDRVDPVLLKLLECSSSHGFSIPAYCFRPDHFHALVEGLVENADFRHFVRILKQVSAFDHRRRNGTHLWQPGYYERIVRDDEETEAIVRYIWENPIRAGLTKQLGEYPYC